MIKLEKTVTLDELDEKEARLKDRLTKIEALERELKEKEKDLKAKETAKKSVLLRLPPSLHNQIAAWAEEDFRSINGQIEFLLSQAVTEKYKKK
ncbi:MAG: toxin-antitoxin system HicB family antitoxin [Clostridia bacterium]|nr:toxin-antitoxin system HicB family antitoxin [Clostridia bacterium]